jgi:HAD superfamily hydrolase (TIGR01662 family)
MNRTLSSFNIDEYKAIIFDLDSTLTNTHRYPLVASKWLLENSHVDIEKFGETYLRHLISRYFKGIEEIVAGAPFRFAFDIVQTAMGNSLRDIGFEPDPTIVEEATQRFKSLHVELSSPYPKVPELLLRLDERGIKLGVITNSFSGNAKIILEKLELQHHFKAIVDCGSVNAYKPMPAPFERTLSLLNADSSETLFVGDEYYADMVGGKRVFLTTVWINHRNHSLEDSIAKYGPETSPDFVMNSISEFSELL